MKKKEDIMGWTFEPKPSDVKARIAETWTVDTAEYTLKPIKVAIKNFKTAYILVEKTNKETENITYFAGVTMLSYNGEYGYEFGMKVLDETAGPVDTDCPKSILHKLTPVSEQENWSAQTQEWAQEWRDACQLKIDKAQAAKKVKDADIIQFAEPIMFSNGESLSKFRIHKNGKKTEFKNAQAGREYATYKITGWKNHEFEILSQ